MIKEFVSHLLTQSTPVTRNQPLEYLKYLLKKTIEVKKFSPENRHKLKLALKLARECNFWSSLSMWSGLEISPHRGFIKAFWLISKSALKSFEFFSNYYCHWTFAENACIESCKEFTIFRPFNKLIMQHCLSPNYKLKLIYFIDL